MSSCLPDDEFVPVHYRHTDFNDNQPFWSLGDVDTARRLKGKKRSKGINYGLSPLALLFSLSLFCLISLRFSVASNTVP